jgi:predicted short-subunit dehydrogenase-like oxidoreductase (DUF2520 family)
MATEAWIESASRAENRPVGNGDLGSLGQHILSLARADEKREAEDRVLAARAVRRMAGEDAEEMLAALGLEAV